MEYSYLNNFEFTEPTIIDFDNTIYDIPMESIPIKAGTVVGTSSVYMYYGVAHTAVAAINVGVGLLAFTAIGVVGAGAMY